MTKQVSNFAAGLDFPNDMRVSSSGELSTTSRTVRERAARPPPAASARSSSSPPRPRSSPASRRASSSAWGTVSFAVSATGNPALTYQWQKLVSGNWTAVSNGGTISGATADTLSISSAAVGDAGRYRVVVTNSSGSATSNEAVLTVTTNQRPTATITAPVSGTTFRGGSVINYAGTGFDPEEPARSPAAASSPGKWTSTRGLPSSHRSAAPRAAAARSRCPSRPIRPELLSHLFDRDRPARADPYDVPRHHAATRAGHLEHQRRRPADPGRQPAPNALTSLARTINTDLAVEAPFCKRSAASPMSSPAGQTMRLPRPSAPSVCRPAIHLHRQLHRQHRRYSSATWPTRRGQRLGPGRKGQQQRRAGGGRRRYHHPQRRHVRQGPGRACRLGGDRRRSTASTRPSRPTSAWMTRWAPTARWSSRCGREAPSFTRARS